MGYYLIDIDDTYAELSEVNRFPTNNDASNYIVM